MHREPEEICSDCDGRGRRLVDCPCAQGCRECDGTGTQRVRCDGCEGTGTVEVCGFCGGRRGTYDCICEDCVAAEERRRAVSL